MQQDTDIFAFFLIVFSF